VHAELVHWSALPTRAPLRPRSPACHRAHPRCGSRVRPHRRALGCRRLEPGYRFARAIELLDLHGDQVFAAAATDLIARDRFDVGALAVACEKHRKDLGRLGPLTLVLPDHLDDADVVPHDLESCDE
jgi:hypothetical protein